MPERTGKMEESVTGIWNLKSVYGFVSKTLLNDEIG